VALTRHSPWCGHLATALGAAAILTLTAPAPAFAQSSWSKVSAEEPLWVCNEDSVLTGELIYLLELATELEIEEDSKTDLDERVAFERGHGYSAPELWRALNRSLVDQAMTTVLSPDSDSILVVLLNDAPTRARLEREYEATSPVGYRRVLVSSQHADIANLAAAAKLLLPADVGTVSELRDSGQLLLTGHTAQLAEALTVITALDVATEPPSVMTFPVAYMSALDLKAKLESLVPLYQQVSPGTLTGQTIPLGTGQELLVMAPAHEMQLWADFIDRFDRPQRAVTAEYIPRRFGLQETADLMTEVVYGDDDREPWRLVTDQLTGTIILSTTPNRHREAKRLVERLESTAEGGRRPIRTFTIHHRQVDEVLSLLQSLLDAGAIQAPVELTEDEIAQGLTAPLPRIEAGEEGERGVVLTADAGTNRIIAFGEARLLDELAPLIETLDVATQQILVEAMVVTLSESDTRDLAVELRKRGINDGVSYELASLFGLSAADPVINVLPGAEGTGFQGTVLDPGNFSAVVRALETVNEGRALTMPKVLINNNESASLGSVVQAPYLTTNASNTVATTSYGGESSAGTQIQVQPQVADADQIVLDYNISISTFVGESADESLPPPKQENQLQAVVTVPDGFTVVVGGLELEVEGDASTQVPFLGDIPVIGYLFKTNSKSSSKSRFYVFLRCTVQRGGQFQDLRFRTQQVLESTGLPDDWPKLEPRVMR
jgi:type II secretory pathway component GspD/PulD (secretin)